MNGQTDIILDDNSPPVDHIYSDLFALRNLLLAIDQARNEGYELNDVSLSEDRCIAKVLAHKLRMDSKINLISFVTEDNKYFQQTLNTLEFALKFRSCLSPELGHKLGIQVCYI